MQPNKTEEKKMGNSSIWIICVKTSEEVGICFVWTNNNNNNPFHKNILIFERLTRNWNWIETIAESWQCFSMQLILKHIVWKQYKYVKVSLFFCVYFIFERILSNNKHLWMTTTNWQSYIKLLIFFFLSFCFFLWVIERDFPREQIIIHDVLNSTMEYIVFISLSPSH